MSNEQKKFLDVEDEEQRQNRLGGLLARLNDSSSTLVTPNPMPNVEHESPGPTEPPTELLERIKTFLPAISASNEALSRMRPEDIDIENVQEDEEQWIEMNLGLGVFETKPRTPRSRSPSSEEDFSADSSSESEFDSDDSRSGSEEDFSSSDEEDDSDSESESLVDMKPVFSRQIKPLPRRVTGKTKISEV